MQLNAEGIAPASRRDELPDRVRGALRWPLDLVLLVLVAPFPLALDRSIFLVVLSAIAFSYVLFAMVRNFAILRNYKKTTGRNLRKEAASRWYLWVVPALAAALSCPGYVFLLGSYLNVATLVIDIIVVAFSCYMLARCAYLLRT